MTNTVNLDWNNLGFDYIKTDLRFISYYKDGEWDEGALIEDNVLKVDEAATALHYGQQCFEGLKAYRCKDGSINLFRVDQNAARMARSCRRLLMPEFPEERFIVAVKKVVKAIQRTSTGLKDPNRPIGTFIFLGTTGVGKTELAKVMARELFDSEESLIRIDMSEYMEKFSVSRLVGAPPGYVGHEEGGQLTETVRRKPYSVVLLDEIEKAHPDVFNILLQILDEGFVTDSLGRKIDFKNTIIVLTSNIGTRHLKDFGDGVGFGTLARQNSSNERAKATIESALKKAFSPEFLNRIDDVIIFNALKKDDIRKIIDLELAKLEKRLLKLNYNVILTNEAKDFIAEKGWDKDFGARPLKRAIQKYIEDLIAEMLVMKELNEGDTITLTINEQNDGLKKI